MRDPYTVSVYDFFYLVEAASIGIEEEVETQSKLYSRLAYQTVIPHIDSSKMSFKKWMDMWHPEISGPLSEDERLLKKERDAIQIEEVSKLVGAVDSWFESSVEGKAASESIIEDHTKNK